MSKKQRPRRTFSPEFRAEAVELVRRSEKPLCRIAKDLDLTRSTLERWVQQAKEAEGTSRSLDVDERAELSSLRREVGELRMERDFLKKAAAFFAKESK